MPVPRPTSRIPTASTVLGTRASGGNRTYLVMDRTPAARPPLPALFPRQVDILEYLYQEEQGRGIPASVTIPARPHATRPFTMYLDARLLAVGDLVTLTTETTVRITQAPHESMPWHYAWIVRLTPAGRLFVQKLHGARIASGMPARSAAEQARRPVADPSEGATAPAPVPVPPSAPAPIPAPRKASRPTPAEVIAEPCEEGEIPVPVCAHCGDPFPTQVAPANAHTWVSPLPEEGQDPAEVPRYHLDRPACRDACFAVSVVPPQESDVSEDTQFDFS